MLLYQTLPFTIHGKIQKIHTKISAPTWNEEFELTDVSYSGQILKMTLNVFKKKHGEKTDNPSITICVNKTENTITFKITIGYYLKFLTPEMMKLLGSTKSKK